MMDYALLKASNSKLKEENTQLKEGQSKLNLVGEEHREECKILRREF